MAGIEFCPLNIPYVKILTKSTLEYDLIWSFRQDQVKLRSLRWAMKQYNWHLFKGEI